jgi:hypothetical protein
MGMTTPTPDLSTSQRRSSLPWVIAGAAVAAVALVVTLVLTTGDDDSGTPRAAAGTTTAAAGEPDSAYDLSTPEAAAASFAAAAGTGSGETLLDLTCVGHAACASEHAGAELTETQATIRDGVHELADHLKGAEFGQAVDGPEPGTKDVPYRTPVMTGDAYLTFVQSEGDWLFHLPAS